jgi:hypothetical protein
VIIIKVKCISNEGKDLSETAGYPIDYVSMSLIVENEYVVYSIGVWDDYLYYLLKPDHHYDTDLSNDPVWYPNEWFEIIDHKIPQDWYFNHIDGEEKMSLILGYKEIALDHEHHKGIMDRNPKDLKVFYLRKKEIDRTKS